VAVEVAESPSRDRLWDRQFTAVWLAQSLSALGSQVTFVAVPVVATFELGASTAQISALAAADYLAFPLCGMLAGVASDRLSAKRIAITASAIGALAVFTVPLASILDRTTYLLLLGAVTVAGASRVFVDISVQSMVPRIVEPHRLRKANSRFVMGGAVTELGGPSVAGILLSVMAASSALIIDAGSYVIAAALFSCLTACAVAMSSKEPPAHSFLGDARSGLSLLRDRLLRRLLYASVLLTAGDFLGAGILPVFVYRHLGLRPFDYGLLLAIGGAGGILGGALASWLGSRLATLTLLLLSLGAATVADALLPVAAVGWAMPVLASSMILFGSSLAVFNVTALTLRQARVRPHEQGRLSAIFRTFGWTAAPLAALLGGAIASLAGLVTALILSACVAALSLWPLLQPLRQERRPT
jgi:MFS family permease